MGSLAREALSSRVTRASLAATYVAAVAAAVLVPAAPRIFWTMLMPLIPIGFVIVGFHAWRRACPLAALASFGAASHPPARRVPRWLARWPMSASLSLLGLGLWVRLVAANGDGVALALLLVAVAALAVSVNRAYSGKSWCNALCPVGVVERIYTDAGPLRQATSSSRCARCTGCVRACADIDQDRSYRSTMASNDRRVATYAFPGLVLAFYGYFRLREGEWAAFFDGRWTSRGADAELFSGPGLVFAPEVPAWAAAALVLLGGACASATTFTLVERVIARRARHPERLRHRMLAAAAFVALNLFYVFAGAPSLALVPGAQRVVALVVPVVATLVLVRRMTRTRSEERPDRKRRLAVIAR